MKKQMLYAAPKAEFLILSDADLLTVSGGGEAPIELDELRFRID